MNRPATLSPALRPLLYIVRWRDVKGYRRGDPWGEPEVFFADFGWEKSRTTARDLAKVDRERALYTVETTPHPRYPSGTDQYVSDVPLYGPWDRRHPLEKIARAAARSGNPFRVIEDRT